MTTRLDLPGAFSGLDPRRTLVVAAYLFIGLVFFTPPYASGNVWARMAPAFALVDHGTLAIDEVVGAPGRATEDVSFARGHVYSNKAPGLLLVSVPVYAALSTLEPARDRAYVVATWLTQVLGAVLPTAVFLLLLHSLLRERYRLGPRRAAVLVWAVAFGTLGLPYSVALFGHQTAAALVGIAVTRTLLDRTRTGTVRPSTAFTSALLLGLAVATDYMAVVPATAWTAWLLAAGRPARRAVPAWIAGALAPALALGAYHWICFGAPWRLPYSGAVVNPAFAPYLGWHAPDPGILWQLTFAPRRGLLFANPLWLAAGAGVLAALRRGGPGEWRAAAATLGVLLLLLASWDSWHGGWGVGPRYLVSALPLAALLLAEGMRRAPGLVTALASLSATGMILVTAVGPVVPPDRGDPFLSWALPGLRAGIGTTLTPADSPAAAGSWMLAGVACAAALAACIVPPPRRFHPYPAVGRAGEADARPAD